ncbi:MAG: hypothetical protein H6930_06140 [Rhodoferax sp.]|nr:hypothetical protein [Rhodoferax sp.]
MAKTIIPTDGKQETHVAFTTTADQGLLMAGDDEVPGMLINPDATVGTLFAIAQSRLQNVESLLHIVASKDSAEGNFADTVRPLVEEVLALLNEGNRRLFTQREVTHG